MSWLHPTFWWAPVAVPLVAGGFWWAARQRQQAFERLGHRPLLEALAGGLHGRRRKWQAILTAGAVGLLALALMGPRYGRAVRTVEQRGVDLVIALDVSRSMLAEDVATSRLARAKHEINELLDELSGHRVGLVLFAGDAFLYCPLTTDYGAVRLFLDVAGPSLVPTPGTNFEAALRTALQAFEETSGDPDPPHAAARSKAILVVSDGENHVGRVDAVLQEARAEGVTIYAAGVGTTAGAPIPRYDASGHLIGYERNREGGLVTTRLEEEVLRRLARSGAYFRITATSSALPRLATALRQLRQGTLGSEQFASYEERFQWPLALALLLLAAERLIHTRR